MDFIETLAFIGVLTLVFGPTIILLSVERGIAIAAGSRRAETGETPAQCEASQSGGNEDCRNAQTLSRSNPND